MKIGIIKEGKIPVDHRVPLNPEQCKELQNQYNVELVVQPSDIRCYTNEEYKEAGITLQEDLSDCEVLMGVKEVPLAELIPNKTYFFFSHTAKQQPYNKKLLQTILAKKIKIVDYEYLKILGGQRVVAFGRWAGIVGAYNALRTYGLKYKTYDLKPAHDCFDVQELREELSNVKLEPIKIALTGSGRVSQGAMEILDKAKIRKVSVEEYLNQSFDEPIYCQLKIPDYNKHGLGELFVRQDFYKNPSDYQSNFRKFTSQTDVLIAGAYWDPKAPVLFRKEEVKNTDFKIKVIADITCDIEGSIPTTVRPSTIEDPIYDYDITQLVEVKALTDINNITVMAVDNLPCELPRDASDSFGSQLLENVMPNLLGDDASEMIHRSAITTLQGRLNEPYTYLSDYIA